MTTNRKRHLKVNSRCFKLHRSYSISFNFANIGQPRPQGFSLKKWVGKSPGDEVEYWRNFLRLNPKGPYSSVEKEEDNFCVVFTSYEASV